MPFPVTQFRALGARQQTGGVGRRPSESRLPAKDPELVFAAGPGIRRVISGELTPAEAIDQEVFAVVAGDATLLERFAATFHIDVAHASVLAA